MRERELNDYGVHVAASKRERERERRVWREMRSRCHRQRHYTPPARAHLAVSPPVTGVPSPDGLPCVDCGGTPFNFTRLGVRVPMLVVSPWAVAGVVSAPPPHTTAGGGSGGGYEHASLPATLAQMLPAAFPTPLTARTAWAAPLTPLWEATPLTAPRTDTPATLPPVPTRVTPCMAGVSREGAGQPNHLQQSLMLLAEGTARRVGGGGAAAADGGSTMTRASVEEGLRAAGALASEAAAGMYARMRMAGVMAAGAPAA